jgi:hypothetical protein
MERINLWCRGIFFNPSFRRAFLFCAIGTSIYLVSCVKPKPVITTELIVGRDYEEGEKAGYKIVKIDSINNVYLIYARKEGSLFKIPSLKDGSDASDKVRENDCEKINVGKRYKFKLNSMMTGKLIGNIEIPYEMTKHAGGVNYYGTIIEVERDSINDIYYADNIKGLCFVKE